MIAPEPSRIVMPLSMVEPQIARLAAGRLTCLRRPPGTLARMRPGDLLWLREPWYLKAKWDGRVPTFAADMGAQPVFAVDLAPGAHAALGLGGRRHARSLPRALHRWHLEITGLRQEPLHAMAADDARAEGFDGLQHFIDAWDRNVALSGGAGACLRWQDNPIAVVVDFILHRRPAPASHSPAPAPDAPAETFSPENPLPRPQSHRSAGRKSRAER